MFVKHSKCDWRKCSHTWPGARGVADSTEALAVIARPKRWDAIRNVLGRAPEGGTAQGRMCCKPDHAPADAQLPWMTAETLR
jgi:hypothetical protein